MPYYSWKGVNLQAHLCKGIYFAPSVDDLTISLFKKDIALLWVRPKTKKLFKRSIGQNVKIDYFLQLSLLVKSGMLLPHALKLIAQQHIQSSFAPYAYTIASKVDQGFSFAQALADYNNIFNPLVIQMAAVGEESGSLAPSLQVLIAHLESLALFKSKLRSALLLPLVTFGFFLAIMAILLIVIVPQFAALFTSMHKELPLATKVLLGMSRVISSTYFCMIVPFVLGGFFLLKSSLRTQKGKKYQDRILLNFFATRTIVKNKALAGFFHSLSFLLKGGMPLIKAIHIAKESIDNHLIKKQIEECQLEVNAGSSFANALALTNDLIEQDIVALIIVAQEAGMLDTMLERIGAIYQQRLLEQLARINTFFQPFLLIILGLLISGLILALYTPIMSLSYMI